LLHYYGNPKTISDALDVAATQPPEEQTLIHKEEMIKVLERAAADGEFVAKFGYRAHSFGNRR